MIYRSNMKKDVFKMPVLSENDVRKGTQVFYMQDRRYKLPPIYDVIIIDGGAVGLLYGGGEFNLGQVIKGYEYSHKNEYEVILKKTA